MKSVFLVFILGILFTACKEVSFNQPQPAGVESLKEIPKALQGHYVGIDNRGADTDTLIVESWGYHFRDTQDKEWLGRGRLSDSLVIKSYENYYFVNFRTHDQWLLRLVKQKPSGDIEFLHINLSDDKKRNNVLKKLSKTFKIKEVHYKDDAFYQINPTKDQLMQLIRDGYFSGDMLSKVK